MSNIKLVCNNCGTKFFTLEREKITCTKCNTIIVVKEKEAELKQQKEKINKDLLEDLEGVNLEEEEFLEDF